MGLKDLARGGGNAANRRRGGSNSALAQRYLAAIDGDAIELVLPSQQQEHQRQPVSPSGRSRSSHTTKSTKQTVRTVGCESSDSAWNETPTPSSPRYRRKPLPLEQHQSGRADVLNASSEQRSNPISARVASKPSSPEIAHASTSKRGFFPRSLLRNVNSPPNKPDISRAVVADRMKPIKVASNAQKSQSVRQKPNPSKSLHIIEHRHARSKDDADESDDGDSSLTSRRTSESKDSPYQSRRVHHHPLQGHFDDDEATSDESSLSDEDDGNEILHHSPQQDYRFYSERSKHGVQHSSSKHINAIPKHRHFSIERSFDQAFEKGLDMILNTNAWACTVPNSRSATSPIPMSPNDTKRINGRSQRNTVMTPPQRRKQRHNALRHSLSAETPRSDFTGAETEIATNRAIDLALKRVREIENATAVSKEFAMKPPESSKHTSSMAIGHVKHVAMNFERSKTDEKTPLLVCKRTNGGSQRFINAKSRTAISAIDKGKLNGHFLEANCQSGDNGRLLDDCSLDQTRSLSSSVGVEIGDRSRPQNKATSALETFVHSNGPNMSSLEEEKHDESKKSHKIWNRKDSLNSQSSIQKRAELFVPREKVLSSSSFSVIKESTPSRPLLNGRPPVSENYVALDPCMSPPQIVRKPQSFDDASPDPVFCSKSMSMSNHSSQMFSHSPSTNASDDPSFQSDDAMFMEKADEASILSDLKHEHIESDGRNGSIHKTGNLNLSSKAGKNPEVSGLTEQTLVTHSDDETSHDLEHGSPYLELLGIRGSFPLTPVMDRPKSPLQEQTHSSCVKEPHSAPLVLSNSLSKFSRSYSAEKPLVRVLESKNETHENDPNRISGSSTVKNTFHTIIAKPHPVRSVPRIDVGSRCEKNLTPSRFSLNSALAAKLSRSSDLSQTGDADVRSVDVKSIRSAFESVLSPLEQVDEDDEEDTASVKSLRERFEPNEASVSLENGITKTRALFEKRSGEAGIRTDVAMKARSSKKIGGDISGLHRFHEVTSVAKPVHVPNLAFEDDDKESRSLNEVLVDSSFEKKPLSVADRIRAFGGGQKVKPKAELSKSAATGFKNVSTKNFLSSEQVENEQPPREVSETLKRSPRRRLSTLRAFSEKAFLCGPSKVLLDSSDVDGTVKRSVENIQRVDTSAAIPAEESKEDKTPEVELMSSSKNFQGIETQNHDISEQDTSALITTVVATQRSYDPQFESSKPIWMLQREKILSKSRQPSRVLSAAIESKRETALLLNDDRITTDEVKSDLCHMGKLDMALSDFPDNPCPHLGETMADIVRPETSKPVSPLENESLPLNAEVNSTYLKNSHEVPKTEVEGDNGQSLFFPNDVSDIQKESIDQYFAHPPPAYTFCRSLSENLKAGSKQSSLLFSSDHSCPNRARTDPLKPNLSVGVLDVTDDKKEEIPSRDIFSVENFGQPMRYESAVPAMPKNVGQNSGNCSFEADMARSKQVQRTVESGPLVVKPVARKPYVKPVPIKPIADSLSAVPFVRSVSDPTARKFSTNSLSQYCQIMEDEKRFHAKAVGDRKYATLELPRLYDSMNEPRDVCNDLGSCNEGSEFSDGVTLDLSIADVSNLTNPTAIVSKLEGKGLEDNRSESSESAYEDAKSKKKGKHLLIDSEGKQSEASSSQTSEAAAPLLARALRTFPLSDEVSTDSFFRRRILVAKHQWSARSGSSNKFEFGPENAKEDDSLFNDDLGGIWDIRQVESLFPVATESKLRQTKRISEFDDWQPFSPTVNSVESPRIDDNVPDPESSASLSRSKTPTRRNTSRIIHPKPSSPQRPESDITIASRSNNSATEFCSAPLDSEASYPLLSTGSSNTSGKRTVVGQLLTSALSGTTSSTSGNYSFMNSEYMASNKSTASSSTISNFGPKHSALLARIHALKESRLRRATRMMAPQSNRRPATLTASGGQESTVRSGYRFDHTNVKEVGSVANSSVQFSSHIIGRNFVANLELD